MPHLFVCTREHFSITDVNRTRGGVAEPGVALSARAVCYTYGLHVYLAPGDPITF